MQNLVQLVIDDLVCISVVHFVVVVVIDGGRNDNWQNDGTGDNGNNSSGDQNLPDDGKVVRAGFLLFYFCGRYRSDTCWFKV